MLLDTIKQEGRAEAWPTSQLQKDILTFACLHHNVDYDTLANNILNDAGRPMDKSTIIVSAHTLAERALVILENVVKNNPKSRILLHPTDKGAAYAIHTLGVDYYKYVSIREKRHKDALDKYLPDKKLQSFIYRYLCEYMVENYAFDNEGQRLKLSNIENLRICTGIALHILEEGKIYPDIDSVIKQLVEYMNVQFSRDTVREAKITLDQIKDNLEKLIKAMTNAGL